MRAVGWILRLGIVVTAGALLLTAVVVGAGPRAWRVLNAHEQTPVSMPPFEDLAERTYVYDALGNEIAVYELENSQPIALTQVPADVIDAILAVEDREFYRHDGVNVRSLVRAALSNFEGGARQGASTITQQVVKIEYLAGLERDGRYKVLQTIYARRLEKERTKSEILERYLNTIYFGNNAYGIQAAAEVYFGKRVEDLDLIEGAFLAGLIQAPSTYDPIRNPEQSRRRFRQVLDSLVEAELLTEVEAERLGETWEIPEVVQSFPDRTLTRTHFTEAVKDFLLNRSDILGDTYQERYNALFRGGLRIHTTLDPFKQLAAEQAKLEQLPANFAGIEASLVSLDSRTGAVLAMVGGRPFEAGRNEVNLALRTRQTGSSIKLFILAAAVQAGAQANDLIDGTRPCTLPNPDNPAEPFEITGGVSRPLSPLEQMTWLSINCAFARLSQIVGLDRVVATTYRMARSTYLYEGQPRVERQPILPYASYATGANEMSAFDMASGAQTLANGGLHVEPYLVERIESPRGLVYQHEAVGTQVLTPEAAWRTTDILTGVLERGTARRHPLADGRVAAGKTGTQEDNTNAWFVGYTPQITTAVWVGHPDLYLPMDDIPEFEAAGVDRVQGGTFPAAIWKAYMDLAHFGLPFEAFPPPPPNTRPAARLYLPGSECVARLVSGTIPDTSGSTTTATTSPPTTTGEGPPDGTTPATPAPPPTAVVRPVDPGTTIARGNTDPTWPLPSVKPNEFVVYDCALGLPGGTRTADGAVPGGGGDDDG
jgi:penicillin-binding protein 1A